MQYQHHILVNDVRPVSKDDARPLNCRRRHQKQRVAEWYAKLRLEQVADG